jgi:hypothetical protein
MDSPVETFNAHRSRLFGIAYRMPSKGLADARS